MAEALPAYPSLGAGVRLRPVPELGGCLAYVPGDATRRPALHLLSATSWLTAALCDGRPLAEVQAALRSRCTAAAAELDSGIADLLRLGVLRPDLPPGAAATTQPQEQPA
jgi:hypothetical protein